jgi:putative endonuclease
VRRHHSQVRDHRYAVYIMASRSHRFYVGVTNDIERRVREHKAHVVESHTAKYNIERLVWYETHGDVGVAIAREKQLKGWVREKKIRLIESLNPTWQDLSEEWGKPLLPLRANRRSFDSGAKTSPPPLRMTIKQVTERLEGNAASQDALKPGRVEWLLLE